MSRALALLVTIASGAALGLAAQESSTRPVMEISEQAPPPKVRAMSPIDDANLLFLDQSGRVGVAKFSPGLSLIGWEFYSDVKWNALPDLAMGPNYSVLLTSPDEVTQAFDTDDAPGLDFFQSVVADWPGRDEGVVITAGPVPDHHGRLLFALSPLAAESEEPLARILAWTPGREDLSTVTLSQLPIADFAIGSPGLLAARLRMPEYKDGYYISLTRLPSPEELEAAPDSIPGTRPSLFIPAEFTKQASPTQLTFFHENGDEKLLVVCPESRQLVEISPVRSGPVWQGSILLRQVVDTPIRCIAEMAPGSLLAGGDEGFLPLDEDPGVFRIDSVELADDGFRIGFTQPLDRDAGSAPESYSVEAIRLEDGAGKKLTVRPVIESDGLAVILRVPPIEDRTVVRILCRDVVSEGGSSLLSPSIFYTVHQR